MDFYALTDLKKPVATGVFWLNPKLMEIEPGIGWETVVGAQ